MKTIYLKEKRKLTDRKIKKIAKKLSKIDKKERIVVCMPKSLMQNEELINQIQDYNISILNRKMAI